MQYFTIPVTPYVQNCSLVWCEQDKTAAVIDPGGDLERILQAAQERQLSIAKILITHGHFDHCAAAADLSEMLNIPIEGPHQDDAFLLPVIPYWCQKSGFPPGRPFTPNQWLKEGDSCEIGQERLEVLHCPGHTPGHLVFYHPQDKIAFVGDVLFRGAIGRTDIPRGDQVALLHSIQQKLLPLGDDVRFIPGHGPDSTIGNEKRHNPYLR